MEKTYNPALIQRTQRYMETHSISQNQFAAKVNLSSAALSSYLNQKYKGSVEAVERQLSEFFKLDEEAEAAAEKTASLLPRAAYVPTSISEDVCQSIRFAQLEHCIGCRMPAPARPRSVTGCAPSSRRNWAWMPSRKTPSRGSATRTATNWSRF